MQATVVYDRLNRISYVRVFAVDKGLLDLSELQAAAGDAFHAAQIIRFVFIWL